MKILIVDGQGGGIGKQLVAAVRSNLPEAEITAAGANTIATTAMLKAGADHAATGENAVVTGCRRADIIAGPIGIVIADSMYGEITPEMALAVSRSNAVRVLIPINHCDNIVAGVSSLPLPALIDDAVREIIKLAGNA